MNGLSPDAVSMLHSILAMGVLTMVMAAWMSVKRTSAMKQVGLGLQDAAHTADLRSALPSSARRVADNFNHLFEVPTLFYAVTLAIVVLGDADGLHTICAWMFVLFRVIHSFVQATVNLVPLRALLYGCSWLALAAMIVRALI